MLSLMTGPIAGPSRLRCFARGFHYTPHCFDTPKRRARITPTLPSSPAPTARSPKPSQTQNPIASHHPSEGTSRTPPLAATWRWHPVVNPSRPDVIEEERTVFARPFEMGRPRMYWFGFLVSGLFFTTWLTFPPSARSLPPTEGHPYVLSCPSKQNELKE